ncbi:MAG: hypothetical protein ACXABI_15350 [Candidatus Hodarchaeales archaeon]
MIDWQYLIEISFLPILFLIFPLAFIKVKHWRREIKFSLDKKTFMKFFIISSAISLGIFGLLTFLTGGINSYYRLQEGIFIDARSFTWNITNHLKLYVPFNPGISLLAVSILTGIVYGGLLTTKLYCEINTAETNLSSSTKRSSFVSSISTTISGTSALASGVVCCSTSVIAFISPAFASALAPIAPWLIIISLLMLNVTFLPQRD